MLTCSVFDVLGRGKHSTVYKGRKKSTIIYYAIKSVDKSEKARVLQQVLHASSCKATNGWCGHMS